MSDNEIREILIEKRKQARREQKRDAIKENIEDALCWICWAALGYMMFAGAYMVG